MSKTSTQGNIPGHDTAFAQSVQEFCLKGYTPPAAGARQGFPSSATWQAAQKTGTALWLDTGDMDAIRELWTQEFEALTTNNTLLNKEVQKGIYDDLVPQAAKMLKQADPDISDDLLVQEIAFVLNAVHGLKLVSNFDADVSVELHTNLAFDSEASYQYGKRYHAINKERFIVKIPLTPEGILAARRLSDDGIRVNFTLGFSARQNYLIAALARPAYLNVFMGRLNAFVSDNGIGDGKNVGEKATLSSQRWLRKINQANGTQVKQIGASIRNGQQCLDLLGLDVFTIPTGAAKAYLEMNPEASQVQDKTANDPEVTVTGGDFEDLGLDKLWEVDGEFQEAVAALQNDSNLTSDTLKQSLKDAGLQDFFPTLSIEDRERVAAESKIPKRDSWVDRVDTGLASWDGLLTEAALASFHQDQMALDDRIRKSL